MKHTKEQISKIAIEVMKDINWTYEESTSPRPIATTVEAQIEQVSTQKNHPRFQEYVDLLFPYWDVIFIFLKKMGGENVICNGF